jgi:hypothetical protein
LYATHPRYAAVVVAVVWSTPEQNISREKGSIFEKVSLWFYGNSKVTDLSAESVKRTTAHQAARSSQQSTQGFFQLSIWAT